MSAPDRWVGADVHGGVPSQRRPDGTPPPNWRLEHVAAVERPRNPEVAPDGSTVAFVLDRDTSDVWTVPVDGGAPVRVTTDRPLAAFWEDGGAAWSPDGARLAYCADGAVHVVAATGGPSRRVIEASSPEWIDDERMLVGIDRDGRTALAVIDVSDPWPRVVATAGADYAWTAISPDRTQLAYTLFHHDDLNCTTLHVVPLDGGPSRQVAGAPGVQLRGPVWSPDGSTIWFTSQESGWYEVYAVDPRDGGTGDEGPRQLTFDHFDHDDLRPTADGAELVAVRSSQGRGYVVRIDVATSAALTMGSPGTWSSPRPLPDGSVVAVFESASTAPRLCVLSRSERYFWRWNGVDVPAYETRVLVDGAPAAVRAAAHVVPEHVSFRSFDGMPVYGWLYRPTTVSADRRCPVVVQPHGGPTSLAGDEWDGVVQYFLDKGYGWLTLNFRGSTGYGVAFERANHGVWGVRDTEDCLAAHDHLASLDWVDAARIAIFGASYGSYLALCSVVADPQHRYRCAVSKYGDCDILTSWAQGDLIGRLDLERMMGHPSEHRAAYEAGSPIHRVEALEVPILVAHGELDTRVHPAQSQQLVAELSRLGKQYEYVTYPTEGHGFLRREPFLHFHRRLERFLDWHLM